MPNKHNPRELRILDLVAKKHKTKLVAQFETRHVEIARCGETMRAAIVELRNRGWETHEHLWNACLFVNTVAYDLSILVIDLLYEKDRWRRHFIARSLALLMFEIGEDIPTVFGRDFRQSAGVLNVPAELLDTLAVQTKGIARSWNENRELLKEIRSLAGAHREHDALKMHDLIDGIDLLELIDLGILFGRHLNDLGAAAQPVISFTATVTPPEL